MAKPTAPAIRFWAKVNPNGPVPAYRPDLGPCWLWTGAKRNREGHGSFWVSGNRWVHAHRYAYEQAHGPIPKRNNHGKRLLIDHLCRVPACVRVSHLEVTTWRENNLRGIAGQRRTAQAARQTHCKRGHRFDEVNTLIARSGQRRCRACLRMLDRKYRAAKRDKL